MYGRYDKCIGLGSGIYVNVREKKKPEGAIKNEQSRDTGTIGHNRHDEDKHK
jgi:hypothetical protein